MCMNNEFTAAPWNWAEQNSRNEAEAFEAALKRMKPEDTIQKLVEENASLRLQIREISEQINRLRETIRKDQEDCYE